jgi:type IV pilus assembly protein PilY1
MVFDPNYPSETSTSAMTDYYSINNLTANGTVCSWQASGTCTWPIPNASGAPENIDDLWHAAVDGRGLYYSATNPSALSAGLTNALAAVQERTGTAAAATTSDPNISQGNNFLFASTFVTMEWTGQFVREQMDLTTGKVITTVDPITGKSVPINDWTAQSQLDSQTWSARNIYTFDSTNANGNKLKPLTWANLTVAEQTLFSDPTIDTMSQLCTSPPTAWQANHAYVSGNQFVASGTPYLVLLGYTSGATFGVTDVAPNVQVISTPVCLPVWSASTFYPSGSEYRVISGGNTTWYHVNTAYTSGATFGATDTLNATMLTGGTNANGAAGANLVNFLRGDRSNEEGTTPDNTKYFRYRVHVLGDIVDSEGAYLAQGGAFSYADPGYSTFTSGNAARQGMVYVAANDGMLHAFYSTSDNMDATTGNVVTTGGVAVSGGAEAWAYVPKMLLPKMYKLADKNYKNQHQYLVDGTPTVGDVCVSNCTNAATAVWKTILVGGLNDGGRGYYALDITNPAAPVALWEFTDTNMGYTFGNPVITKLSNGTWVVLLTSGYNNVSPGDGQGHLYVLDAYTGTLHTGVNGTGIINTGAGDNVTPNPSGLARITAEVIDPATNNTVLQVYGGDLLGNLWRFDVNNNIGAAGFEAQKLTQLVGPGGVVQPITVKPEVGLVGTSSVIYVGTGRFLGTSDILATDMVSPNLQSIYGIYDPLTTTASPSTTPVYANPRSNTCNGTTITTNCFLQQTLSSSICPTGAPTTLCSVGQQILTSSNNPGNIPSPNVGWYVDLPFSGQRDNTDPALQRGTLDFTVNLPTGAGSSCTNGGSSYNLTFDYKSGGAVNTAAVTYKDVFGISHTIYIAGVFLGNALATRPIFVELPSGAVVSLIRMGTGETTVTDVPIGSGSANTRRVSWRELMQ